MAKKGISRFFNQLFPHFLSSQFKTLHHCCRHTEDVHLKSEIENVMFEYSIFKLRIFQAMANTGFSRRLGNRKGGMMGVGLAAGQVQQGASPVTYRHNFLVLFLCLDPF